MALATDLVRRVGGTRSAAFVYFAALLLLMLSAEAASANVPSPVMSVVPRCLPVCPSGDRSFTIIVRDITTAPVVGAIVTINLSSCAALAVALCDDCAQMPNYNAGTRTFTRVADAAGQVTFKLCGSITCAGGGENWAQVAADGVLLANSWFVTTDLDVDLDVDAVDVVLATAAEGGVLPAADQDCSRSVDGSDTDVVEAHLGHACPGVVPAAQASWGTVKSIYR